ncbi:DMT family transporter [Chitiniphilus purpureus]|uniref:DMT family transporter n=1 Tax=Chitiniphilus purpureus TaxID=2981137 RepID=A0ABY6DN41_9NEIS|nr:DMT family transporter [Chitiniphilus sp. CD1]UXY15766.1 DMT family transporter [Chitiniphilus sp. CD1]
MNTASALRLILLAAIWGASFLFMRLSVPVLGPVIPAAGRVMVGAAFLGTAALLWVRTPLQRTHWRHYAILGLFNTALPFLCYGLAARTLTASLMSILNATTPIWGALVAAVWLGVRPTLKAACGLLLGVVGVAVLVGLDSASSAPGAGWAIASVLVATFCYALASSYGKRHAAQMPPFAAAHGSMWAASALMAPLLLWQPAAPVASGIAVGAVLALGVVCTGAAYLLYFRLVQDIGPAPTLTVTFLIPVFGVLWGVLLLGETIGHHTLVGAALVLVGTALATGFDPRKLGRK